MGPSPPLNLDSIHAPVLPAGTNGAGGEEERQLDLEAKRVAVDTDRQLLDFRKTYSNRTFWLLVWCLSFTAVAITADALPERWVPVVVSEKVIIAMISAACVEAVGLFALVNGYIFATHKK